jgi:hypothetical protein
VAAEGERLEVNVTRRRGTVGVVALTWHIQGVAGFDPTSGFQEHQGSFTMEEVRSAVIRRRR